MKKLLLAPALVLAAMSANAQLALQNFNSPGMPAGWTMINDGKTVSSTISPAYIIPLLNANAWTKFQRSAGDSAMISTSYFATAAAADRWLITPPFPVTDVNMVLSYLMGDLSSSGTSPVQIMVGPSTATVAGDFTSITTYTCGSGLVAAGVPLGAYNGTTIRIAFRSIGNAKGFPGIDDVETKILPAAEAAVLAITPRLGSQASYAPASGSTPALMLIKNNGATNITSIKINYKVGSAATVSETKSVSLAPFATTTLTFTTPISGATTGATKMWIELAGDAVKTNDTLTTYIGNYTTKPTKKILAEEGTGTWCQWCPRGAIYMDSVYHKYPANFSVVAVHNSVSSYPDPMLVASYDTYLSSITSAGFPRVIVDRSFVDDPDQIFTYYTSELSKFSLADIVVTPTMAGTTLTVKAVVTPKANTNADYRLALVLTENRVAGTTTYWAQQNAYSGGGAGAMANSEFDFVALPNPVPGSIMKYDFVARGIYPGPTGASGSLPMTMTSGSPYTYTFPGVTIPSTWKTVNMKAIVMLINNFDGTILNTQTVNVNGTAISEIVSGVNDIEVYPNPAKDVATTKFTLTEQSNVSIEIVDMLGKVVKTVANKSLTAGTYEVPTNVSELASGLYLVKITTDKGSSTERLSVVK